MPLEGLPDELLLQVALHLPDSGAPRDLKNLSLASRKLRSIAQEALFRTARLAICCGCHPKVNALILLLRTLLDRPDLATKVKLIRFRAVRKTVEKLYTEQGFDLPEFRNRCISKLAGLGYHSTHPWWRSINNSVESAFGGLLLALLPNLTNLDFWIKDHQRGPPSSECISGLWGGTSPPEAILHGWKNVTHLTTGDTSMLKCGIHLEKLTLLDLRTVSIGTVLRLNGPGSLQGAENLESLALTVSIQFADRPLVEKAEITFSELLDALACRALKKLKIAFINDGYHIGDDLTTELSASYFLDQLCSVERTLETLSITLETTEEDGELDWLIDMCQHPTTSMKRFSALKTLTIPQPFVFNAQSTNFSVDDHCRPKDLPPTLEQLELLWPYEGVVQWAEGFRGLEYDESLALSPNGSNTTQLSKFKKIVLTCRDDAGVDAGFFTDELHPVWWELSTEYGIEAEVRDQQRDTTFNLVELFEAAASTEEDSDIDEDDIDEEDWDDEDDVHLRTNRRGPPEAPDFSYLYRTTVLAFLKDYSHLGGLTVDETVARLDLNKQRVLEAVQWLLDKETITASAGVDGDSRLQFLKASEDLMREKKVRDSMAEMFDDSDESERNSIQQMDGNAALADDDDDDDWEDDEGTDEDMPDLEAFDPTTGATIGPVVAPLSRVGLVTETAVLRLVRQFDPSRGMAPEEIASRLGTHLGEVVLRTGRLVRAGHVREDEDRVYFVNENAELLEEDLN